MDSSCVFCRIVSGEIPSKKLYEDDEVYAFADAYPVAPVHILIIPKMHVETLDDVSPQMQPVLGKLMLTASELARQNDLADKGYRVVMNCRSAAGQSVYHIHLHLLGGGDPMGWPPWPSNT